MYIISYFVRGEKAKEMATFDLYMAIQQMAIQQMVIQQMAIQQMAIQQDGGVGREDRLALGSCEPYCVEKSRQKVRVTHQSSMVHALYHPHILSSSLPPLVKTERTKENCQDEKKERRQLVENRAPRQSRFLQERNRENEKGK
jgi:hypothetical protein